MINKGIMKMNKLHFSWRNAEISIFPGLGDFEKNCPSPTILMSAKSSLFQSISTIVHPFTAYTKKRPFSNSFSIGLLTFLAKLKLSVLGSNSPPVTLHLLMEFSIFWLYQIYTSKYLNKKKQLQTKRKNAMNNDLIVRFRIKYHSNSSL